MIAQQVEEIIRAKRAEGVEPYRHVMTVETRIMTGSPVIIIGLDAEQFSNGVGESLVANLKATISQHLSDQPGAQTFISSRMLFVGESPRVQRVNGR